MTITNNSYTIEQIDRAMERTKAALIELPEGSANGATVQMLLELYLGALDADKQQAKSASK